MSKVLSMKSRAYQKVINYVLWLIVILSLLGVMSAAFFRFSGVTLEVGKFRMFMIITGSMEPKYKVGDFVIISKINPDNLNEGDIIAFISQDGETNGEVIIHRVCSIRENHTFTTRGDANPTEDSYTVEESQILGKVTNHLSLLGSINRIFLKTWVFLTFIATPLGVIILIETAGIIKRTRQSKSIVLLIKKYNLDPNDTELQKLVTKYGDEALRLIAQAKSKE